MLDVSRETQQRLELYVELLREENERQNLVSATSLEAVWSRHIDDSLQLLDLAPREARWLDIGSGPGLPGIVLAIAGVRAITLVEPRPRRTAFLAECCEKLGLANVTIVTGKAAQVSGQFDVVTARAVAPLDRLFAMAAHLVVPTSHWVLPKGRSAAKELAQAQASWQGRFRLVPSRTDPEAQIVVASGVKRRAGRG